jgi:hypothetical protein
MKNISLYMISCVWLLFTLPVSADTSDSLTTERRSYTKPSLKSVKDSVVTTQSYQSHVWFDSVDIRLSGDLNANGYFHRLEVEFDADTSVSYQPVFAEFSLLPSRGNERVYYTSSIFELYRQSADDWLAIDTVLQNRFAADNYLLTIRLFDANTGYLLAEISGFDDINLDYIPLEDYGRDSFIPSSTTVQVSAGTTGIIFLLTLCFVAYQRRYCMTTRGL